MSKPPLADLRILDFSALLPGAVCSLWLADLGAEVIKIEPPVHGEAARGPAGTPPGGLFHLTNRNKKSLALDLKEAAAIATLHQLVESADAVLESFRPGVMARLGLDYPTLRAINPRLVYCSLTGY
ncbi:MAG TPA: CoA transferase, partial [Novosphingobium sp.]|nr:CoA transferase [Novosphingobium sp.]